MLFSGAPGPPDACSGAKTWPKTARTGGPLGTNPLEYSLRFTLLLGLKAAQGWHPILAPPACPLSAWTTSLNHSIAGRGYPLMKTRMVSGAKDRVTFSVPGLMAFKEMTRKLLVLAITT
jgi:hypothetical protein